MQNLSPHAEFWKIITVTWYMSNLFCELCLSTKITPYLNRLVQENPKYHLKFPKLKYNTWKSDVFSETGIKGNVLGCAYVIFRKGFI